MSERQYGILGTTIVHGVIILLLIFTFLSLPKPAPSEGGILINFGDVPMAGGMSEPKQNNSPVSQPQEAAPKSAPAREEGVLTQDFEDAPAVKKATEKKTEKKPVTSKVNTKTPPAPVEKQKKVNSKALYSNKGASQTETGTSEGIYKGNGNMGDPDGTPESDNYSKGLGGQGIITSLKGRNPLHLQEPEFNILKEGIVVVEITVDRTGKVISASPGVKGSTIVDNTLYASAKKAALESRFTMKNDATERQVGTITYHFKLQ